MHHIPSVCNAGAAAVSSYDGSAFSDAGAGASEIVGVSCAYPGRADPGVGTATASAPAAGGAAGFWASAFCGDDIPTQASATSGCYRSQICVIVITGIEVSCSSLQYNESQ